MADVSTWDPADENNNKPPPDGWPEFMMPSQVNNSARMMMGAVKRMYDQLVGGSLVLPYLRLSGGTVSGSVTVSGTLTAGTVSAPNIFANTNINSIGSITASGNISGGSISTGGTMNAASYDLSGSHLATWSGATTQLYDRANVVCIGLDNSIGLSSHWNNQHDFNGRNAGAVWVSINSGGITVKSGGIAINNGGGLTVTGAANISGTATTGHIVTTNVTASGAVTAPYIASSGNINATGQYTGGSMNLGGEVRGGSLATGGNANISANCNVGSVLPNSDFAGICGGASLGWHDVVSYNYVTLSDAALKTDIGPLPDTLALVSAIAPQAFRYGDEEARHWGFIAQDVRAAVSGSPVDLVSGEEGRLGLDYNGLTAMLWKAVQELNARLTALEGR